MRPATWQLEHIADLMRELSRITDPEQMLQTYRARAVSIIPVDRSISLSRRNLIAPQYRITQSDLLPHPVNPWKHPEQLPLFNSGLLGELLYAGQPKIIDDLHVDPNDPAREYLDGMRSLAAIPHYDDGEAINMVIHLRREANSFNHEHFPELVLLSGMFGRTMRGLVLNDELRTAQDHLKEQYDAVSSLSDTVIEQARELKNHSRLLEDRVRARTADLDAARLDAIYMLAAASEAKDEDTGNHVRRIEDLSYRIAKKLGESDHHARTLGQSSILHDVGKIHIADQILKKPGALTAEERTIMQGHTVAGEHILNGHGYWDMARHIARSHHENWDGSGYPDKLSGNLIPREARIVHVADVYDALTHPRAYKKAWSQEDSRNFLREQRSQMFDPNVVDAFLELGE